MIEHQYRGRYRSASNQRMLPEPSRELEDICSRSEIPDPLTQAPGIVEILLYRNLPFLFVFSAMSPGLLGPSL